MAQKFYADIDVNKNQLLNASFQQLAEPPANPIVGQIYFSTLNGENQLKIYNGTSWQYVDNGSAIAMQSDWLELDSTSPAFIKNKPDLSAQTNINNNSSSVIATLSLRKSSASSSSTYGTANITLSVNGSNVTFTNSLSLPVNNSWVTVGSKTITVSHNMDGTKSITISATGGIPGTSFTSISLSGTATLDSIARESTITASSTQIGGTATLVVTQKNSSYTHSISYSFGSLSGYITSSGGTTATEAKYSTTQISFSIPSNFASQMNNISSLNCTYTCRTYNGSTLIGITTAISSISISSSTSAPTVSGTVVDNNSTTIALTGNSNNLIKYFSTAYCTISATAKAGATITQKTINNVTVSGNTRTIYNVENNVFSFAAYDSRNLAGYYTVTSNMINYVKLTNNATVARVTPTGNTVTLKLSGSYFNGSFGATNNILTCKYRKRVSGGSWGSYTTVTASKSGNTYSYSATLSGFTYTQSYELEVVVTDKLMSVSKIIDTSAGVPIFDWGADDFNFNVSVNFNDNIYVDGVAEGSIFYVGSNGLLIPTGAGTSGQVLAVGNDGNPTWQGSGGSSGGLGCIRVKCSGTSTMTIGTSTSWNSIAIPFNSVVFNSGDGLTLDASSWHSVDCSEDGYIEITGSAYFQGVAAYNKYMSLHLVSNNNTEIISVKRSAMEGPMIIGPYIVPYSSSMRYFTLCARSDATDAAIITNNPSTWLQAKYIA